MKCFINPADFSFVEHWSNDDCILAAKIASNVTKRYSLPCNEKKSFILTTVFSLYKKQYNKLCPTKINLHIRAAIKNYIESEVVFTVKHQQLINKTRDLDINEIDDTGRLFNEIILIANKILLETEFSVFEYWIYDKKELSSTERSIVSRAIKKIRNSLG